MRRGGLMRRLFFSFIGISSLLVGFVAYGAEIPFPNVALSVPGTIQAENFDNGGEGVAYHDLTSGNSGNSTYRNATAPGVDIGTCNDSGASSLCIGWINAGEWLKYSLNIV